MAPARTCPIAFIALFYYRDFMAFDRDAGKDLGLMYLMRDDLECRFVSFRVCGKTACFPNTLESGVPRLAVWPDLRCRLLILIYNTDNSSMA